MDDNKFTAVPSLQDDFLREASEKLMKAQGLRELALTLAEYMREIFAVKQIQVLYKASNAELWEILLSDGELSDPDILLLNECGLSDIKLLYNMKYTASVVFPLQDFSSLGILMGHKSNGTSLNEFDKVTLQVILQIFNGAYKSIITQKKEKELLFELNEKVLQLNQLINTGIEISRFENRNRLFEYALENAASLTNASAAAVRISYEDETEQVFTFPSGVLFDDISRSRFKSSADFNFRDREYSFMLQGKETRTGLTDFDELDQLLLKAVTRQVAAAIENEYLHMQSVAKELIEKEISLAASIQQRIIPGELPKLNGYDAAGINIPSVEIGGDYYDFIKLKNDRVALIIADVAGKGISAALLVNTLNASLYSYLEFDLPLTEIVYRLNKIIYRASPQDKYVTFFIALLDQATGKLEVVNAGHNPVFLIRGDGRMEKIDAGGIGLGMFDMDLPYNGQTLMMEPGDKLFLYTDGIPEAMNEMDEEFSDEAMLNFLKKNHSLSVHELLSSLVHSVKEFAGSAKQSDDITVLILAKNTL